MKEIRSGGAERFAHKEYSKLSNRLQVFSGFDVLMQQRFFKAGMRFGPAIYFAYSGYVVAKEFKN
jgi:hypothetical protein